jgi:hypothetical protein
MKNPLLIALIAAIVLGAGGSLAANKKGEALPSHIVYVITPCSPWVSSR